MNACLSLRHKNPEHIYGNRPLDNQFKIKKTGNSYILYDASILDDPSLQLFDCDYHTNSRNRQNNSALPPDKGVGRAKVIYFSNDNKRLVLKHYYRGGLVASLVKDRYLGFNIERTRAFREWRLLKSMHQLGLPVPVAVAARVEKGLFYYRADLITGEIENVKTLAERLSAQGIDESLWQKIGACIKLFHRKNIYHADLNARNILVADTEAVYLIDFDNSYFRAESASWKMANLARLKRSLLKFKKNTAGFNFSENNWTAFLEGYEG